MKTTLPKLTFLAFVLVLSFFAINLSAQTTQPFSSSGSFAVPAGVTSITVEAWGGGGAGGRATTNGSNIATGGGGGGGAYVKKQVTVTAGTNYIVTVASTKASSSTNLSSDNNGNPSVLLLGATEVVKAMGGVGGAGFSSNGGGNASGGAGSLTGSIGDVIYTGGNGGTGNLTSSGAGGGGAGSGGNGGNALIGTAGNGTSINGGNGGSGITGTTAGNDGTNYGGGGSGARTSGGTTRTGGSGAAGYVVISYTCPNYSLTSTSVSNTCANNSATVTLSSTAAGLPLGSYTVTYSIGGANTALNQTANLTVSTAGSGNFTINSSNLAAAGLTNLTISKLASGNCNTTISTGNTNSFTVNPPATLALSSAAATTSQSVCINTPIQNILYTVGGSGSGAVVSGLPAGVAGSYNGGVFTISGTPTQTGTYSYTVSATSSCSSNPSLTGTITVNALPTITLSASAVAKCFSTTDQTTTLAYSATTGSPTSYSIAWNTLPTNSFAAVSNAALSGSSGNLTITIPANTPAGTYTGTLTVKNANGCSSTGYPFTLTVNPLPTAFTLTGPDGAVAQFCTNGTPATFTLSGSQQGVTYTFVATNPGGNNPPGQSLQVPGVGGTLQFTQTPDGRWSYSVNAKDDVTGCTNTMIGDLKAVDGPQVTSQPTSPVSVCTGGPATALTVTLTNATSVDWQVSTNGGTSWSTVANNSNYAVTKASNYSTTTLTISNYTTSMSGNLYRVVYGGPSACPINYSNGTVLNVSAPPAITVQPASKTVCQNSTLYLSVTALNASNYQWYKNGSAIAGATTAQYTKIFDAATDAGSYFVTVTGTCGSVNSSTISVTANTATSTTTWQGPIPGLGSANGTAWEVESNWSCGVPTRTTDAVIPADVLDGYPTIKSSVTGEVRNLTVNGGAFGAYVTVQGKLQVYGSLVNSGGIFDATAGTIEFSGSTSQIIPAGFFFGNTVQNLIISNDVSLAGNLNLKGALSFGNVNNKTFSTANYLTLKSDAAATARVADLTNNSVNSGNSISGNVTVERYMPNYRRYRLVTSPVKGATINSAWQEGRTWNGTGTEPSQFGTLITGASQGTATNANNNGFDFWTASSGASVFKYSGSLNVSSNLGATWTAVTNTRLNGFDNHEAYLLYVRGDRTVTTASGATVLRGKGPLKEAASYVVPITKQSHVLIGNPFAGPLNFSSVYNDNSSVIETYYWIWQASLGTGTGGYVLMMPDGSSGYEAIPYGSSTTGTEPVISSGEGFFVVPKASAVLPTTITIQQKHKTSTAPMVQTFRVAPSLRQAGSLAPRIRANVFAETNGETVLLDGAMSRYSEGGGEADVVKAVNGSENLAVVKGGKNLILASNELPKSGDTLQLRLWNLGVRDYRLQIGCSQFGPTALSPVLVDKFRKTETSFSLAEGINYAFSITADAASKDPLRFSIVFKAGSTLPLQLSSASAIQKGQAVQVEWQVNDESGVKGYVVEKSADGSGFQVLSEVKASRATGPASYSALDASPFATGYYHIRMIGTNGEIKYSPVMKVQLQNTTAAAIAVYPNPVINGIATLQLTNQPQGSYKLSLVNAAGQQVWQQSLQHQGGSAAMPLSFGRQLAAGFYTLDVSDAKGKGERIRIQVVQ